MLIERQPALKSLRMLAERGIAGRGSIALLRGEAGIGKTSVLNAFRERIRDEGRVLWGGCDALFTPRPLGPIYDMAAEFSGETRRMLDTRAKSFDLFPQLVRDLDCRPEFRVVVIEDVHWADNATIDFLKFLGRRISMLPTLLILSFRHDEIDDEHPFSAVLKTLPRACTHKIDLEPLSLNGVHKLCHAAGITAEAEELYKISSGNPFFVNELLSSSESPGESIPASIKDAVNTRLLHLSDAERDFLETLSILPGAIPTEILEPVFGESGELLAMAALGRRMLVRDESSAMRFRHELARLATISRIPPTRQRQINARLLDAMISTENLDPTFDQLVHHAAGALNGKRVLEFAPRAAEAAAAVGAHREAAAHWSTAMRFVDEATTELAAEIYESWAYEAGLALRIDDDVIDARRHAITLWRALDRIDKVAENFRWLSRLHWYRAESAEATRYADEAVRILENAPASAERAMGYSLRSQLHMLSDDMPRAVEWGEKALALAEELDETEVRIHALCNIGTAEAFRGSKKGVDQLLESLSLAKQHGFHEHAARVYTNLSEYGVEFKDFELAERITTEGIAFDTQHDLDSWTHYLVGRQAQLRCEQGRLRDAETIARGVIALDRQTLLMKLPSRLVLSRVLVLSGSKKADSFLAKTIEHAVATEEPQHIVPANLTRILHGWLSGQRRIIDESLHELINTGTENMHAWYRAEIAMWGKRLSLSVPKSFYDSPPEPYALEFQNNRSEAAKAWNELGSPISAAIALAQSEAAEELADGLRLAKELGAEALELAILRRADVLGLREELPKLKRGPYKAAKNHPLGLTKKEQAVLTLLIDGQSNPDIAKSLSRSRRTVENHVSSILKKLGVDNRMEAMLRVQNEPWLAELQ